VACVALRGIGDLVGAQAANTGVSALFAEGLAACNGATAALAALHGMTGTHTGLHGRLCDPCCQPVSR
jgi:hypothetical protein